MVTFDDIQQAAQRISGIARRTPVLRSGSFDRASGLQAWFKCENFQKGGAFKIRGAANFINSIPESDRAKGVVAFSSGNHAQAVAIAARAAGMKAVIVMPTDAPKSKLEATRGQGAEIVLYDRRTEDREMIGKRIAEESGALLAPPFDHPWIIAGQGTAGLELLESAGELDTLVVCLGGGGLLAGCAIAARALRPGIRIYGVEPALGNDYWLSVRAGERIAIPPPETIADGLRTTRPGVHTFPVIQQLVDDILLVSEEEIKATVKFILTRMKIVVEPSGAVAAAAALHGKLPPGSGKTGILVSGGNVDLELLASL